MGKLSLDRREPDVLLSFAEELRLFSPPVLFDLLSEDH